MAKSVEIPIMARQSIERSWRTWIVQLKKRNWRHLLPRVAEISHTFWIIRCENRAVHNELHIHLCKFMLNIQSCIDFCYRSSDEWHWIVYFLLCWQGQTALHVATATRNNVIVEWLIKCVSVQSWISCTCISITNVLYLTFCCRVPTWIYLTRY